MANQIELSKGTEYEFGPDETATLKTLAGSLMMLVVAWSALGTSYVIVGLKAAVVKGGGATGAGMIAVGVLSFLVAVFFFRTRAGVHEAATTEGYDITNVMRGMKRLRTLHTVQGVWFIVNAIVVVLYLIAANVGKN